MIGEYLIKKALYRHSDRALEAARLDPSIGPRHRQEIIDEQLKRRSGLPSEGRTGAMSGGVLSEYLSGKRPVSSHPQGAAGSAKYYPPQQPVQHEGAPHPELPGVNPNPQPLNPIQRWIESRRNPDARMQPRQLTPPVDNRLV